MRVLLLALFCVSTFGFGEHLTPLQKWALELEYKAKVTGHLKDKPVKPRSCASEFEKAKEKYNSHLCDGGSRLMKAGMISGKKFSHDEIESMPKSHPHLRSTIRGTNKLINYAVYSSAPTFPHTYRECENFFSEEVSILNVDGKLCREIKFTAPELGGESYSQIYCEDNADFFITIN